MAKKINKALKCWVQFVKKVQREEKLSYPEAMKRAKQRKDKGEKWMKGGGDDGDADDSGSGGDLYNDSESPMMDDEGEGAGENSEMSGGRRRRRRGSRRSRRGGRSHRRRSGRSRRSRRTRRRRH